jgi:hypothetical protein
MNNTVGAKILYEQMQERQFYMRRLRGSDVCASVKLGARLFKTARWGTKYRPDLVVQGWVKFTDNNAGGVLPSPTAPQLPPAAASAPLSPTAAASFTTTTSSKAPPPPPKPATPPPPPAPRPAAAVSEGLSFLQPVEKPNASEELDDAIPW